MVKLYRCRLINEEIHAKTRAEETKAAKSERLVLRAFASFATFRETITRLVQLPDVLEKRLIRPVVSLFETPGGIRRCINYQKKLLLFAYSSTYSIDGITFAVSNTQFLFS